MGKKVIVSKSLIDKLVRICDIAEFSARADLAKLAKEARSEIDKGPDYLDVYLERMEKREKKKKIAEKCKDYLLKETIAILSADIFQELYNLDDYPSWSDVSQKIIELAEQFEKQLDWKDDDRRDYIQELDKFEKEVLEDIKKNS